jgi:hypothetical protein
VRKLILALLVLAVLVSGGLYYFARQAPDLLRQAIERAIEKNVRIESIEYRFPWSFVLRGFRILETREPFADEVCFEVDKVDLEVSPLSLSASRLILDRVDASEALIVVRNRKGKLMHALSDASAESPPPAGPSGIQQPAAGTPLPLAIRRFRLSRSRFQLIDYDVREEGFVTQLDDIEAGVQDLAFPPSEERTFYRVDARMPQGRQRTSAVFRLSGWSVFRDSETDALLQVSDLSLAYFKPYYSQVTPAEIEEGSLSTRAALRIHERRLTTNIDLELNGLYFKSYEEGEQLFGMRADEILAFLKDSAGKLKFQIVLQWQMDEKGVEKRRLVREAIERSLQKTVLGNVGNILEKTIQQFSDSGLDHGDKEDLEDALQKVKKLFQ